MWTISKRFDFCYGHRVWSQTLNEEFALDTCLKCRHLHGHQGEVEIFLESDILTDGMVTDFKHLNWFKKWLDETIDHKFIMDIHDPLLPVLFPKLNVENALLAADEGRMDPSSYILPQTDHMKLEDSEIELYEGLVLVLFVPTSENISEWFFTIVSERMKPLNVGVQKVTFNETPKSQSSYSLY